MALQVWDIDYRKNVDNENPIPLRLLDHIFGPIKDGQIRDVVMLEPSSFDSAYVLMGRLTYKNNYSVSITTLKVIEIQCGIFGRAIGVADAMFIRSSPY